MAEALAVLGAEAVATAAAEQVVSVDSVEGVVRVEEWEEHPAISVTA